MMTGPILNALGVVVGGVLGLLFKRQLLPATQLAIRGLMGVATVYIGLRITWNSLHGSALQVGKEVVIVVLALALGRIAGRVLRIQTSLNRLGQFAGRRIAEAKSSHPNRFQDGFIVCTLLFCAGPLGPIGAVLAGLTDYWEPLAIKMVMDGLAAMGFVAIFGWGALLSAVPLLVYLGAIALGAQRCLPFLAEYQLLDSVNAVGGLLVFCVALIVLELKKLDLADYLPSLLMAPLITWLWR